MSAPFDSGRIRVLLLDVEGTTTPVRFVTCTLFPFAAARVEEFLERRAADSDIGSLVEELRRHREADVLQGSDAPPWREETPSERAHSAAAYARCLMERDSKLAPLKSLQGHIWDAGYRSGALRGEVYADVPQALVRWREQGRRVAIFSSGSVLAQKLLFGHSTAGDLTPYLDAYFDTTTGPKRDASSYRLIAAALDAAPGTILFLSDTAAELDAAHAAGFRTALSLRPDVELPRALSHSVVHSFREVFP